MDLEEPRKVLLPRLLSSKLKYFQEWTIIRNGKKVTVTQTKIVNADGTIHTEVTESTDDGNGRMTENRYLNSEQCKVWFWVMLTLF